MKLSGFSVGILLVCERYENLKNTTLDTCDLAMVWSSFSEEPGVWSIPREVDRTFEELRTEYLRWLSDLGNTYIDARKIVGHFQVRPAFSMWWMSLMVEKSQWKSLSLYQIFRLMALDRLIFKVKQEKLSKVVIDVSERPVRLALKNWCNKRGIPAVILKKGPSIRSSILPTSVKRYVPWTLRAFAYFSYLVLLNRSAGPPAESAHSLKGGTQFSFFSYFFNLDRSELDQGRYLSRYWIGLREKFLGGGSSWNWLHLFIKSPQTKYPGTSTSLVRQLNTHASEYESHRLLGARMPVWQLANVLKDYIRVWRAAVSLKDVKKHCLMRDGLLDIWPLLSDDWMDSFYGKTAVSNAFYLNMFESVIQQLPYQKKGFYLLENQAWERALIYAWRNAGNGLLVGVMHSTVSSCDLRHFFDPSEYKGKDSLSLPVADFVGVNGEAARRHYLEGGFPADKIIRLEGLRYLYLHSGTPSSTKSKASIKRLRLLVLGDYSPAITQRQMSLLSAAGREISGEIDIFVKSHPACKIDPKDWPMLALTPLEKPLEQLSNGYDVAFTSNSTGAAVDAYLSGKPVLSILDPETFNLSPLRGFPGVKFVATPGELIEALFCCRDGSCGVAFVEPAFEFLYTDPSLRGWREIFAKDQ